MRYVQPAKVMWYFEKFLKNDTRIPYQVLSYLPGIRIYYRPAARQRNGRHYEKQVDLLLARFCLIICKHKWQDLPDLRRADEALDTGGAFSCSSG